MEKEKIMKLTLKRFKRRIRCWIAWSRVYRWLWRYCCISNKPIHVQVYLVKAKGDIKVQNEIKEAIWIDRNYKSKGIKVGSILGKYIIPQLIEKGLM